MSEDNTRRGGTLGQPARLFWAFSEPFLTSAPDVRKQRGRIAREVLPVVWSWIGTDIIPTHFKRLEDVVEKAVADGSVSDIATGIVQMKKVVGPVLKQTLIACRDNPAATRKLIAYTGNDNLLGHVRDICDAMEIEPVLARLVTAFPIPLSDPAVPDIEDMFEIITDGADKAPHCHDMIIAGAIDRFEKPAHALRLAHYGEATDSADELEKSPSRIIIDVLLFDLEHAAENVIVSHRANGWSSTTFDRIGTYYSLATGIQRELVLTEGSRSAKVVAKLRTRFAETFSAEFENVTGELRRYLEPLYTGDLSTEPSFSEAERIGDVLTAAVHLKSLASELGLYAVVERARKECSERIDDANSLILELIRRHSGTERENARAYLDATVPITEVLQGREAGRIVRRLGAAASTVGDSPTRTFAA